MSAYSSAICRRCFFCVGAPTSIGQCEEAVTGCVYTIRAVRRGRRSVTDSAGIRYRSGRERRQVEHVARLVVGPRVHLVNDELAGGVFRQAGGVALDERGDHQLAVGRQTGSQ